MKGFNKKGPVASRIIQGLGEFAEALANKVPITEEFNCRVMELDLRPTPYSPELVKATRKLLNASQMIFARFLGVSVKTVRAWEQGVNIPSNMACRFMDEIRLNPVHYLKRLRQAAVSK